MAKVPITEQEKLTPYYKYYLRDITPLPQEKLDLLAKNPLTPQNALKAHEMNELFKPGYLPGEFGWTRFEDGTLTIANCTKMPGVTVEMFDWWFVWHGLEPMRYKIWDPEDHYYCLTRNPAEMFDENVPLKQRCWNTSHDIEEDVGIGKSKIHITFRNPVDIGFDPKKFKDFDGSIICSGNEKNPVIMCHFIRPIDGGIELRTRFWMGYCIKNGKPKKTVIPPPRLLPTKAAIALLEHNIKEFTHLAAILPEVYAEFHDKF